MTCTLRYCNQKWSPVHKHENKRHSPSGTGDITETHTHLHKPRNSGPITNSYSSPHTQKSSVYHLHFTLISYLHLMKWRDNKEIWKTMLIARPPISCLYCVSRLQCPLGLALGVVIACSVLLACLICPGFWG